LEAARTSQLLLIVGTSGAVQPAASVLVVARESGARLVEINPQVSALSGLVDWRLQGPAGCCLPALIARLGATGRSTTV